MIAGPFDSRICCGSIGSPAGTSSLHAINGGGQNMSRACLTGALAGAQVGLSGIPELFVEGLTEGEEIVRLAEEVGEDIVVPYSRV